MGEMRYAYNVLVAKTEGKSPPGRPMHRLKNRIRMDVREMMWDVVDWIHVAQGKGQ
jgi:hypothetical protein